MLVTVSSPRREGHMLLALSEHSLCVIGKEARDEVGATTGYPYPLHMYTVCFLDDQPYQTF